MAVPCGCLRLWRKEKNRDEREKKRGWDSRVSAWGTAESGMEVKDLRKACLYRSSQKNFKGIFISTSSL
jgi:hypothetical protein